MIYLTLILQVLVALGLLNVWLLRKSSQTKYRGGSSQNLKDEFSAYGLPAWVFYIVGAFKIGSALALVGGIWIPELVLPAASIVAILMIGAIVMHLKVKDAALKFLPAACMLLMSGFIVLSVSQLA